MYYRGMANSFSSKFNSLLTNEHCVILADYCMTILWREVQNHVTSPEVINISETPISVSFPDQPTAT